MQMLKHVTCTCSSPPGDAAYGKWIDNNLPSFWALKDLTRNEPLWRQHKKGQAGLLPNHHEILLRNNQHATESSRSSDSIYSSFNKLFYVFITIWLPQEKKWAGKIHAQEVNEFFSVCAAIRKVYKPFVLQYFAMVDCLKVFGCAKWRKRGNRFLILIDTWNFAKLINKAKTIS